MLIHTFFKNADTATRIFLTIIENLAVYLIILKLGIKVVVWGSQKGNNSFPQKFIDEKCKSNKFEFIVIWSA